tara:strand:+ start:1888 stop:2619 length:732 start_codon:yes stop_codon:yes gene_type:complete
MLGSSCSSELSIYEQQAGGYPHNAWGTRRPLAQSTLQRLDSDVFLLQEVNDQMLHGIRTGNPHMDGYEFQCSHGNRGNIECAIGYKTSVFRLERRIEYKFRALTLVLARKGGPSLSITSCHLKAGEDYHNDVIRERQARTIAQTTRATDCACHIVGGDLNSDRRLQAYYGRSPQALRELEAEGFSSNGDHTCTFYGWDRLKFDYIYFKGVNIAVPHTANWLSEAGPNEREASDHTALSASFTL